MKTISERRHRITRTCADCHRRKPLDEFYTWTSGGTERRDSYCKECRKLRVGESRRRHPQSNREACRRYYAGNRAEVAERRKRARSSAMSDREVDDALEGGGR